MKNTKRRKSPRKPMNFFSMILLDLALAVVALLVFSYFHHEPPAEDRTEEAIVSQIHSDETALPGQTSPAEASLEEPPVEIVMPVFTAVPVTPADATAEEATLEEIPPVVSEEDEETELLQVYFMNVGRNDGILVRMGDECAFIDGGMDDDVREALRYINEDLGIDSLKYYIATHGHTDHVGCAGLVLSTLETETILYNSDLSIQTMKESAVNQATRDLIDNTDKRLFLLGDTVTIGDAVLTCVGPEKVVPRRDKMDGTENENSIIIRLTYGERSFLLTGDATSANFLELLENHPQFVKCDVIKGAHHDNPINKEFLAATGAEYYVYSTGEDHPPTEWDVNMVRTIGARVFVTSPNSAGNLIFTTDGSKLDVQTQNTAPNWKLDLNKVKLSVGKTARCPFHLGKDSIDTLCWTVSDDSIVRIEYGFGRIKIHALAPGICTVTATNFDGTTREIIVEVRK